MDDQEEDAPSGSVRLNVNRGQIVTPPRGIVQLEVVIAFTMGTHTRLGGDSPVFSIGTGTGELLRLVLVFASLWCELDPWVVTRRTCPADSAGFEITNGESSDARFDFLIISDMGSLSDTRNARFLARYFIEIGNITQPQSLTWTESELL
jgi:hypothetical protein